MGMALRIDASPEQDIVGCFGVPLDGQAVPYDPRTTSLSANGKHYVPYVHGDSRILVCGNVPTTRRLETVLRRLGLWSD